MNQLKAAKKPSRSSKESLYQTAQKFLPGGVNSPVRAFRGVGGEPVFMRQGKGPFIWDEAGKKYADFCCSWGALLFGHAPTGLVAAVHAAAKKGTSFGTATRKEVELAQRIQQFFPSMQKMRLVSSGTEAVMSAIRLARGFTGRKKILKIEGGYHGHADSLLVKAGSGGATFGVPDSAGVPEELAQHTLTIPFNDLKALREIFQKQGSQIAAFILEPVPANMGVIPPQPGYLEEARKLTQKFDALFILDEVITGFRISAGGAQKFYKVRPDLTCLGKILGGGLPLAAFGGRREIMDKLSPEGPVYQAGTLSGNPVAVAAALWVLEQFSPLPSSPPNGGRNKEGGALISLNKKAADFYLALKKEISKKSGLQLNAAASMFTLFFADQPVTDYASAKKSDTKRFARFFHHCLAEGVYLAPSQFEANFISTVHGPAQLDKFLRIFKRFI